MEFVFQDLVLDLDTDRTRRLYTQLQEVTEDCRCGGCRNYMRALRDLPPEVTEFFRRLGIEPGKATEVITWGAERGGLALHYGGFYHLCGRLLRGPDCWTETGAVNEQGMYALAPGCSVGFTRRLSLPEAFLPAPALQLEIDFHGIPWKLGGRNPYEAETEG